MLCCGRKKGRLDQEPPLSASRFFQNICITSNHPFEHQSPQQTHRSLLDHSTFSRSKQPLQGDRKRHQQKQRCLYSRSYPESEAVAFGGRPLLHDRSMERNTRTAGGHRQRGHEKYSHRGDQKALVPCHNKPLSNNSTWKSKENHHLDMGIKSIETFVDYTTVETVEINKRPGQTLGFYIREGNGIDRTDGVFISRIAAGSAVERNGLLRVGEEILAIDGLSLKGVCLDDVVILMSIPSRLLLTVKTRRSCCKNLSCPSLPLTPTTKSPPFLLPTDFQGPHDQPQVFAKKKFQHSMAINPPYMQHPYSFYPPYQPPLPHKSFQKPFFPPLPSFQQQQHYYDPYLRPLKTIKPTYKDIYYGHKQPKQSWYQSYDDPVYDFSHSPSSGYYDRYSNKDGTRRNKKQVESLDRKIQGVNGRKNRKLDYFSDGETQMACEYLYGLDPDKYCYDMKDSNMDENNDDFAGVKKLSRSLSRRKKSSKINMDQLKFEQKQLSLEKQIERQEQQLYLLQQQLKLELQNQKLPLTREQELSTQTYYKPILRHKSSYPSYFNQYDNDQTASTYFQQNCQPYYPPLQFEHDAHFYDLNDFKSKQKSSFDKHQIIKTNFHEDYTFNNATPSHRKRYSSDSDIQNGNGNGNYVVVTSSPSTAALEIVPGLLSNGEKSNSLPAEIENGALSSNGDDPNQLKHWLRKLDRLSYDLREFNGRLKNGTSLKANGKGKEKSMKLNGNEYKKPKYQVPTIYDTNKPLARSGLYENYSDDKKLFKGEKKPFDYSSEEYKSWLYDRRLQNKLKKERTEKYHQHTPSMLQQQQRQQQRLKPISSRDRAKLALSESRQRMAQSQFGPKSELKQKHHAHLLKKKLTATASQTTPSIHTGKSKSRSLDHDFDEGTYDLSSGVFTASKSKTLEKTNGLFYDSHDRNTHSFDLPSYQDSPYQADLHSDMKLRHRHQNSMPEADSLIRTEHLETDRRDNISESGINDMNLDEMGICPELLDPDSKEFQQMYGQNLSNEHNKKMINDEKLKTEPMKIKVGEFHPHQNDGGDLMNSKHNGKSKHGNKNGKHKNNKNKHIFEKEELKNRVEENKKTLDYQNLDTFSGSMYVKIFCGHGLKSTRRTVLRDLYCVLSVDGESKARTAAKTGAINFDWDEDFEIDLSDSHTVNFSIYSWDPVARQRLCYTAQLIIEDFIFIHGHERRLAMKLQPSGTLYVELKYKNMAEKFTRVPVPAENAIFGAVLDDLIARETSIYVKNGSNAGSLSRVPRFVRACVYEVELRGLDSMGIYRLSGSYTRLNKLKQKLEEHYNGSGKGADSLAWNGNGFEDILSANSVPDINIVAGLLKSLLLELPDPLMCGDLYDMFIDAVKLQMQDDFNASVSLMLSVLDCLPKNNLAVFSFLMDHLKKVEQEKNLNMMNSKSLGEIFGPLLLCPPISDNGHLRHQRHKRYRTSSSVCLSDQAQVIAYLIDIWPSQ